MENVIVGRNQDCDFRLLNGSVSRLHAVLKVSGTNKLVITDTDSKNGTFLWIDGNWKKIETSDIKRTDRLRFGEAEADVLDILGAIKRRPKLGGTKRAKIGAKTGGTGPAEKQLKRFKKPRRNKITGDIEEGG